MKIDDVIIGDRARSQTGWLDDLERSIEKLGVLQPIGVTAKNELIFGYRRLMACKNIGLEEIPARVIDIDADDPVTALRMEQAENNIRRDFTPTEKVEIARRIEEALAGRHGGDRKSDQAANICTLNEKGNSRDIAAQSVGWSGETYRQAKAVTDSDDEEAKSQLDAGDISVNAAYKKVTRKKEPLRIVIKMNVKSDAKEIMKLGDDYADALMMEIAKLRGHKMEVNQ